MISLKSATVPHFSASYSFRITRKLSSAVLPLVIGVLP